jgi:hypothetical protein
MLIHRNGGVVCHPRVVITVYIVVGDSVISGIHYAHQREVSKFSREFDQKAAHLAININGMKVRTRSQHQD